MQWCHRLEANYGMDLWIWQSLDGPSFCLSSKLDNSIALSLTHKSSGWVPGNLGKLAFHLQAPEPIGLHTLLSLIVDDLVQLKNHTVWKDKEEI